jgi:hypothetical protein
VRTHPPLQVTFPPKHRPRDKSGGASSYQNDSDSDDARESIRPLIGRSRRTISTLLSRRPTALRLDTRNSMHFPTEGDERWVSVQGLLEGTSPYVSLDQSRLSAYSPSLKASFLSPLRASLVFESAWPVDGEGGVKGDKSSSQTRMALSAMVSSRLPNPTMNFDLRTLNLHLALRMSEILACAEAMWEWVLEYQKKEKGRLGGGRSRSGSVDGFGGVMVRPSTDRDLRVIAGMTRRDFDGLLAKFES